MIYLCISTIEDDKAEGLATALVEEGLAACVNIIPKGKSIYRWEGKICHAQESVLLIKTAPHTMGGFEERFKELHPYDCPELLVIPIEDGLKDYLNWVQEATT